MSATEQLADEVESRSRKICAAFGVDPDEVTDPYGPVVRWHEAAYHINEAIETVTPPQADEEREALRKELAQWPLNGSFNNGSLADYLDGIWRCIEATRTTQSRAVEEETERCAQLAHEAKVEAPKLGMSEADYIFLGIVRTRNQGQDNG